MVVPFIINILIKTKGAGAFFSSFLAIGGIWFGLAWLSTDQTSDILASRIAMVLPLRGNKWLLIALTGLVGGLAGALAGYTGNAFRNLFARPKENTRRSPYARPDYRYR